jgi:hypothetical protein
VTQIKLLALSRLLDLMSEFRYVSGNERKGKNDDGIGRKSKEVRRMQSQRMSSKVILPQSVNLFVQFSMLDFLVSLLVGNGCCA